MVAEDVQLIMSAYNTRRQEKLGNMLSILSTSGI